MQVIAHRGYHGVEPENTLAAFAAAMAMGCAGIETDVRLSADRQLILFHDRVRDGVAVSDLARDALSARCGYQVPTLDEALQAFPAAWWNIEIKTMAAAELALPRLAAYQTSHRLLVTSFCHDVVVAAAQQLEVACGLLNAHRPLDLAGLVRSVQPYSNVRTLVWDAEIADAALIAEARSLGFANAVYSPKTQKEHEQLHAWGVDAVITDYPQMVNV